MGKKPANPATPQSPDASCRVVLLAGPEAFLRALHTTKLRQLLEEKFGPIDTLHVEGKGAQAADVLDECRSMGLLAGHKMVIVDNAHELVKGDNRALFERYVRALAEDPSSAGSTLVLRCDTWHKGNLDALIDEVGVRVECEGVGPDKAVQWACIRAEKHHQASLSREVSQRLIERVGTDLGRLDSELGKLAAAAGMGKPITRELLDEFVGLSREESVWEIQGGVLGAQPEDAIRGVRNALDVSRHPPVMVMFALTDLARKVHATALAARSGANFYQLRGPLKLFGPQGEAIFQAAKGTSPAAAGALFADAVDLMLRDRQGLGDIVVHAEVLALRHAQFSRRNR